MASSMAVALQAGGAQPQADAQQGGPYAGEQQVMRTPRSRSRKVAAAGSQSKEVKDIVAPMVSNLMDNMRNLEKTHQEVVKMLVTSVDERAALEQEIVGVRSECERRIQEERVSEERLAQERAAASKQVAEFRAECEKRITKEQTELQGKMAAFRAECELKVAEETAAMERKLEEARRQTDAQLQAERRSTDQVRHVLSELPPLQAAMELGDVGLLENELRKWKGDVLPERFGECKGVVEAVVKLARERLISWRGVEHVLKDVLKQVERLPGTTAALLEHCHRLFRALKEAQLTKMDLRRSHPQATDRICEVLLAWQERAMSHSNRVQKLIVRKVVNWPQLGQFDFADLDICLRLVDRQEQGNEVFLTRARAIVEDETTAPKDLRSLLSHVETMLFFLKYTKAEDLRLTHAEFRKQSSKLDSTVAGYLSQAERDYPPGAELVRLTEKRGNLMDGKEVAAVLEEIRRAPSGKDNLGIFRDIFYQWAVVMKSKFDLLVLPHHTQVVCLLAFRAFLEAGRAGAEPHALIAQVGTGEGKSMIIAALALYVVVALRKKAHIVVDDETLLERDFWTFKPLFDAFQVPTTARNGERRGISSILCVSEERVTAAGRGPHQSSMAARVDPDADICYCEAKHVQSFYASIARGEKRDFDGYEGRVLILDEVDALIIDEEPNEAFVYPNPDLSDMATSVAEALASGASTEHIQEALRTSPHPATERVIREMTKEWAHGRKLKASDDFVYAKEAGRYCAVQGGRANPKAWSLALECRNFQDGLCREILFQERLFVMSRPRVFRKYHRILGLSGSIGSGAERTFLKQTYRAAFFEVPPFLKTCRGSPFHEAVPVGLGTRRQAVYVELTAEAQLARLAEVAFEARERVPVLVIARDRGQCDQLVEALRQAARSRGLGGASTDMVRSLSRTLYESDPEQWKDNLNRSTLPLGDSSGAEKCWRVTVTDPRGGRGTDYRVDDPVVDAQGGLLLIPTAVPTSQREWTQFLGRTARQDRHGQFCAVLCASDYAALSAKYGEPLPEGSGGTSLDAVEAVIRWGDREVAGRIRASAALYNCGVRVNELCEELFGRRPELLRDPAAREHLVEICQRLRWMSVREVDETAARIPDFQPARITTEARDLGRPVEPPAKTGAGSVDVVSARAPTSASAAPAAAASGAKGAGAMVSLRAGGGLPQSTIDGPPKVVIFCLDWSLSMLSQDTGTNLTRFGTCVACIRRILRDQVRNQDLVGVVGFGAQVETVVLPTAKGVGGAQVDAQIASLQAQMLGGTCFFDAVSQCLQQLGQAGLAPPEAPRWLVCLTDGDDLGSRRENMGGELVTRALETSPPANLNMVMITVGKLKEKNLRVIDGWVDRVAAAGGFAQHLSERNAAAITSAFSVVAECLSADVGGATEC